MLEGMSNPVAHGVIGRQNWLQHHLPWLAVLSVFVGFFRDEAPFDGDFDDWAA